MTDFWLSSGHLLLDRDAHGHLAPSDEFLKLYLARPEMVPPGRRCRLAAFSRSTATPGSSDSTKKQRPPS